MVGYLVKELGYIRNLVEPCWLMRFVEAAACNVSQILLEVDDFIVTALLTTTTRRRSNRTSGGGLPLGKWETGAAEYAGRRARTYADRVLIDQAKYIREQVHPIPLEKHRKQDKKASLNSLGGVLSRCSRRATSHLSPSIAAGARVANTVREAPACGAIGCFSSCATEHRGGWHL